LDHLILPEFAQHVDRLSQFCWRESLPDVIAIFRNDSSSEGKQDRIHLSEYTFRRHDYVAGDSMKKNGSITTIFLDIGGVLLSDGWDRHARKRAATTFNLDLTEMETRHHLTFETYEEGELTMNEYLELVVFYKERSFTQAQFRRFMFAQSISYPKMIELIHSLKVWHGLKIIVVSNEARELNAYRVRKFKLGRFVDSFITSCFVHLRKPDSDIFRLALDIAQVPAQQVVYIDNTPMFIKIASSLGIRSILHTDYASTCAQLDAFGLQHNERATV
jgi:putative hydrolase of the HAD superfamily